MSDTSQGVGWWRASDGKWYEPESHPQAIPDISLTPPPMQPVAPPDALEAFSAGSPASFMAPVSTAAIQPTHAVHQLAQTSPSEADRYPMGDTPLMSSSTTTKPRRIPAWFAWTLAGIFFATTVALAFVALHENSIANGWHKDYQKATIELAVAHASIASLNKQVSTLNGQVGSLNTQLAAQASAKEKALDQNTVLSQLVGEEGTISTELNTCVSDLQTLISTVANDLGSGNYSDPSVSYESDTASSVCSQAQSDNRSLQTALSGATG